MSTTSFSTFSSMLEGGDMGVSAAGNAHVTGCPRMWRAGNRSFFFSDTVSTMGDDDQQTIFIGEAISGRKQWHGWWVGRRHIGLNVGDTCGSHTSAALVVVAPSGGDEKAKRRH